MKIYEPDVDVFVVLPFTNVVGESVTPSALDYQVVNEAGSSVIALTNIPVFDATAGEYTVIVPAISNALGASTVRAYRKVELRVTVGADVYWVRDAYVVEKPSPLSAMVNSFQTYEEAVLKARGLADMEGWEVADDQHRMSALMQAYDHMHGFAYRLFYADDSIESKSLNELTLDEWSALQPYQQADFQKAQIVHANHLLGGNPIERDIDQGLQSSTIGEVSQFYRPRPTLSLSISRDAFKYVGKYVVWSPHIGRT